MLIVRIYSPGRGLVAERDTNRAPHPEERLQAGREDAVARVERALERGAEDHRRAALAHEVRGFDPRTRLLHLRGNAAPTGSSTESV